MQTASPSAPAMPEARPETTKTTPATDPATVPFKVRGKRKAKKQDLSTAVISPPSLPWGHFSPEIEPHDKERRIYELREAIKANGNPITIACAMTPANYQWILKCIKFSTWIAGELFEDDSRFMRFWITQLELPFESFLTEYDFLFSLISVINEKYEDFSNIDHIAGATCYLGNFTSKDYDDALMRYTAALYKDQSKGIIEEEVGQ